MRTPAYISWHVPAIVFFAAGAVAGCVFIGTAPVAAVRILGVVALMSGVAGASLMMLAMQMESPTEWDLLRENARILVAKMRSKPVEWWRRDVARWTDAEHARVP
jgi:hypothetical protein